MLGLSSHTSRLRELALGIREPHQALPFLHGLLPGLSVAQQHGGAGLSLVLFLLLSTNSQCSLDMQTPASRPQPALSSPRRRFGSVLPNLMSVRLLLHQPPLSRPSNLSRGCLPLAALSSFKATLIQQPKAGLKGKITPWYQIGIQKYTEWFFPAPPQTSSTPWSRLGSSSWLSLLHLSNSLPWLSSGPSSPPPGLISKQTVITFQTDGIRHSIRELMHRVARATGTLGLTCLHLKA